MNNKTVAICGFSTATLGALQHSKADEIWTLNHAFAMSFAFPRFDRVFELHHYGWFLRKGEHKLTRYYNWLRQKHPFPIYMQKVYKSFPSSVRYPKEEVDELIFSRLIRGGKPNLYYTSSFGYMIGLAILEGWKTVEIHGIDMTNDTEYNFQKPGGEFMIGVALGYGLEVVLHPNSHLCQAQLYAYDRVPAASRERAEELAALYEKKHEGYSKEAKIQADLFAKLGEKDPRPYMEASAYSAMYAGGAQIMRHILAGDEYYFGRQSLENERHKYYNEEEKCLALTNEKHAIYKASENGNASQLWNGYLEARATMYAYSGARQAIQKLIDECDMKVVPDEMRMEIRDE